MKMQSFQDNYFIHKITTKHNLTLYKQKALIKQKMKDFSETEFYEYCIIALAFKTELHSN